MRVSRGDVFKLTTLDRDWDEGGKTPNPWTFSRYPPRFAFHRGAKYGLSLARLKPRNGIAIRHTEPPGHFLQRRGLFMSFDPLPPIPCEICDCVTDTIIINDERCCLVSTFICARCCAACDVNCICEIPNKAELCQK